MIINTIIINIYYNTNINFLRSEIQIHTKASPVKNNNHCNSIGFPRGFIRSLQNGDVAMRHDIFLYTRGKATTEITNAKQLSATMTNIPIVMHFR